MPCGGLLSASAPARRRLFLALNPQSSLPFAAALQRLNLVKHRHARAVAAGVAVVMGSLSALALAVAPLAPDPADLPQRWVTESVQTLDVLPQLEALAEHPMELSRSLILRGPEGLASIFKRAGLVDAAALGQLAQQPQLRQALAARGARSLQLRMTPAGRLVELTLRQGSSDESVSATHFDRLVLRAAGERWQAEQQSVALSTDLRFAAGTIRSSLFAATDDLNLPDAVATQLAEIFSADIDFHRELRKGDSFSLVYEALTADGEPVPWSQGTGRVLAAEFRNGPRLHQAIWFAGAEAGKGAFFDAQGNSRKRQFLASPLEFSRVTSGFAMRMHPVLRQWRAHRGVDYAAPTGTPVRTVGDGMVEFAGVQSGYGKVIEVRHAQDRSTLYAHLSRIDVRVGQRVTQGSTIGAVGSTGMSTGPHLHFEFRVAGVHQDPLQIARQAQQIPLDEGSRQAFGQHAQRMKVKLVLAQSMAPEAGRPRFE
ncbi:MAG: M23 family metallopeptidase [Rubrivivax sp.]|nr:M23 family metallopeptidase [Rubrivivax sp.]